MTNVISIRDKINEKMNLLEKYVELNLHQVEHYRVQKLLEEIHKYYSLLEPEDRQYVDVIDDIVGRNSDKWF